MSDRITEGWVSAGEDKRLRNALFVEPIIDCKAP
jgi:hypothetical protein